MTTYRHPKLERTAKNYGTTFILEDNKGEIMRKNMYEQELLALGFEEVVEKDWIDELYNEIWKDDDEDVFREVVLKHAPKVKKFTSQEVVDWISGNDMDVLAPIIDFLRDHDLLEE